MALRYWVDSYGCAKNQVDAENLMAVLDAAGYLCADGPDSADLIIVNSCGFIESAKKESIQAVISHKESRPSKRVVLAGCLAERYAGELAESLTEADAIFGNGDLSRAPELLARLEAGERPVLKPERVGEASGKARPRLLSPPRSAYLKITEGCSNRCAFCAIPLIRGDLRSRGIESIAQEAAALEERGILEINLVGQDLGSFGAEAGGPCLLPEAIEAILASTGKAWIRALYIHPDHFPKALLDLARRESRFLPYFDIPFQHGSAPILKAMGRKKSPEEYRGLVADIRSALPQAIIRSSFMTGFPGETDEDFSALRAFLEGADLDWAGFFSYSREEGTAAAAMKGRVSKRLALQRKKELEAIQEAITSTRMEAFVGKELDVLVEEIVEGADEDEGAFALGRAYLQAPEVDGLTVIAGSTAQPGDLLRCRILRAAGYDLSAISLFTLDAADDAPQANARGRPSGQDGSRGD